MRVTVTPNTIVDTLRVPYPHPVTNAQIIDAVLAELERAYVLPDRVPAVSVAIRAHQARGKYDQLAGPVLVEVLTDDIHAVCPDKHLRVFWTDEADSPVGFTDTQALARYWAASRTRNHGVVEVSRLMGNVGYLELQAIDQPEHLGPLLLAAMTLLANSAALILDLRENRGGSPAGVAFMCSLLLPVDPPTHVNDVYDRRKDSIAQYWTASYLPIPRYDRPAWVLTSARTFSGGEELAYNLQQLGRATVVGEVTRGGAHPVDQFRIAPHLAIQVPTRRSINPISGTNWEGTGVTPDVAVPAGDAFEVAHLAALQAVLAGIGDTPEPWQRAWRAEVVEAIAALSG
jgi:Peptidase family S41